MSACWPLPRGPWVYYKSPNAYYNAPLTRPAPTRPSVTLDIQTVQGYQLRGASQRLPKYSHRSVINIKSIGSAVIGLGLDLRLGGIETIPYLGEARTSTTRRTRRTRSTRTTRSLPCYDIGGLVRSTMVGEEIEGGAQTDSCSWFDSVMSDWGVGCDGGAGINCRLLWPVCWQITSTAVAEDFEPPIYGAEQNTAQSHTRRAAACRSSPCSGSDPHWHRVRSTESGAKIHNVDHNPINGHSTSYLQVTLHVVILRWMLFLVAISPM
jgi:hypothetical protein